MTEGKTALDALARLKGSQLGEPKENSTVITEKVFVVASVLGGRIELGVYKGNSNVTFTSTGTNSEIDVISLKPEVVKGIQNVDSFERVIVQDQEVHSFLSSLKGKSLNLYGDLKVVRHEDYRKFSGLGFKLIPTELEGLDYKGRESGSTYFLARKVMELI